MTSAFSFLRASEPLREKRFDVLVIDHAGTGEHKLTLV